MSDARVRNALHRARWTLALHLTICVSCGVQHGDRELVEPAPPFNATAACRPKPGAGTVPTFEERIVETGTDGSVSPLSAQVGSVDGDGAPDLLIASSASNSPDVSTPAVVTILRGRRDGLLETPGAPLEMGRGNYPLLVDVDGDGRQDVTNERLVAYSRGHGGLEQPVELDEVAGVMRWGSLDTNAPPDQFIVTSTGFVVRMGLGEGRMDEAIEVSLGRNLDRFYVGMHDLDDDGLDDVVTLDREHSFDDLDAYPPATVSALLNEGDGQFTDGVNPVQIPEGVSDRPAFGDFDCDGLLDLVACNPDDMLVRVWPYRGDGWGPPLAELHVGPDADVGGACAVAVGDVNGDGAHDLVTGNTVFSSDGGERLGNVEIFLGDGAGGFSAPIILESSTAGFAPNHVTTGDLNDDGLDDLIVLDPNPRTGPIASLWLSVE